MSNVDLRHGDCLAVMRELPDNSVDAICTDPPYGLAEHKRKDVEKALLAWLTGDREHVPTGRGGFMGKEWDRFVPPPAVWDECFRVLKPGGHLLAFAGSRTFDLMAISIRLAGLDTDVSPEIRDSIAWLYGSGFPKSLDVGKAIDKKRDDKADVLAVTSALADLADAAGITRADLDERMGTSDMGGWWLSRLRHRCACPSVENWTQLRDAIPGARVLDAEVWRLNGRKGKPGEAWDQREVVGQRITGAAMSRKASGVELGTGGTVFGSGQNRIDVTAPATEAAKKWAGFGTAMKPGFEPVICARKPLAKGLGVAQNVQQFGTGALNIEATRIGADPITVNGYRSGKAGLHDQRAGSMFGADADREPTTHAGRWPANVALDSESAAALDQMSGTTVSNSGDRGKPTGTYLLGGFSSLEELSAAAARDEWCPDARKGSAKAVLDYYNRSQSSVRGFNDSGGASRFFLTAEPDAPDLPIDELAERFMYCAKAPKSERPNVNGIAHPTCKPLTLMKWLVRLVTPPGGTILEPFAGSGTTVEAAILEGFDVIAIEREADYLPLIQARIFRAQAKVLADAEQDDESHPSLFDDEGAA